MVAVGGTRLPARCPAGDRDSPAPDRDRQLVADNEHARRRLPALRREPVPRSPAPRRIRPDHRGARPPHARGRSSGADAAPDRDRVRAAHFRRHPARHPIGLGGPAPGRLSAAQPRSHLPRARDHGRELGGARDLGRPLRGRSGVRPAGALVALARPHRRGPRDRDDDSDGRAARHPGGGARPAAVQTGADSEVAFGVAGAGRGGRRRRGDPARLRHGQRDLRRQIRNRSLLRLVPLRARRAVRRLQPVRSTCRHRGALRAATGGGATGRLLLPLRSDGAGPTLLRAVRAQRRADRRLGTTRDPGSAAGLRLDGMGVPALVLRPRLAAGVEGERPGPGTELHLGQPLPCAYRPGEPGALLRPLRPPHLRSRAPVPARLATRHQVRGDAPLA